MVQRTQNDWNHFCCNLFRVQPQIDWNNHWQRKHGDLSYEFPVTLDSVLVNQDQIQAGLEKETFDS